MNAPIEMEGGIIKKRMIKIASYQNIHQHDIDKLMEEIALEFDEPISPKPTNSTPLVPDAYWVALNNDEVIGTVGIIAIKNEFGVLKKMLLKKSFRGKDFGVSKLLLQTVINWCAENNINQIYLGTMSQFKAAQMFYEKNGFRRIPEKELPNSFLNNPLDKVFFQQKLNINKIK